MSCTRSTYFDKDNLDMKYQVSGQLLKLVDDTLQTNNSNKSYVYDEMIKWLKGLGMFKFPTPNARGDEGIRNLLKFIKDVLDQKKTIKEKHGKIALANIIGKIIEQFSGENFQIEGGVKEARVSQVEVTPEQETKGTDTLTEEEKEWIGISNIQKLVYGISLSAKLHRQTLFERDLVRALIIDVNKRSITTDDLSLNINIGFLKNDYYLEILKFMRSINPNNNYSDSLYTDGKVSPNYELVLNDFLAYLQKRQKDNKEQFNLEINQGWRSTISNASDQSTLYKAANAYINLVYFDSLLTATLGKVVSISPELRNLEVDIDFGKYSFGTSLNNMAKGWETSENRNALEEMGKFSKLLILSIPLYEKRSGKYLYSNISLVGFTNAFTNLFASAIQAKANGSNTAILNDILDTHGDPGVLIPRILRTLLNNKEGNTIVNILKQNGLNDFDLNILYSVYKYCFDGLDSIDAIEKGYNVKKYTLIDCILGVIDRVTQVDYLETLTLTNGTIDVSVKTKFHSRQLEYNLRNGINKQVSNRSLTARETLVEKYKLTPTTPGETSSYTIKIGSNTYIISLKGSSTSKSILEASFDDVIIKVQRGDSLPTVNFDKLVDLSSSSTVNKLLKNSKDLTEDEVQFLDAITFIQDQTLLLNLTSSLGLDKLLIMRNLTTDGVSLLLLAAVLCAIANDLYYKYNNLENTNLTFLEYVKSQLPTLETLSDLELNYLFSQGLGTKELTPIKISDDWVNNFTLASAILSGEVSRAVTKDIFGNAIANYSTAYLGANLLYYFAKYRKTLNAANNLFFVTRPEFILGQVVNFDFQNRRGDKKNVKKLNTGELLYTHIIDSFWGLLGGKITSRNKKLKDKWIILPTTYSDKTKIIEYIINPDRKIDTTKNRSYAGKTLRELTSQETAELYSDTIGDYYRQIFCDLVEKYYKIFPELGSYTPALTFTEDRKTIYDQKLADLLVKRISEHLESLNNLTTQELTSLAKAKGLSSVKNVEDFLIKLAQSQKINNFLLDTTYRVDKSGKVLFNELLDYYANYLYKPGNFKAKLERERVNFINDLLKENVSFYTKYLDRTDETTKVADIIEYFAESRATEDRSAKDIKNDFYKNWVKDGRLILGKKILVIPDPVGNNDEIIVKDIIDGSPISQPTNSAYETVTLNPLLEEYFIKDSFISTNLRLSLTGSEIAHMAKVKASVSALDRISGITKNYLEKINLEECASQGAQLKRNVIIPATLLYMTLNTLIGVPPKFKVAVFRDKRAPIYNFRGDNGSIDSQDGSAKILGLVAILENNSLQDLAVGEDRKPIWHSYDTTTGTSTLLKFATNTMTNERMLESLGSDLNLYHLFKKMTNLRWHTESGEVNTSLFSLLINDIDLLARGYKANSGFDFLRDILQGQRLFYKEGNQIREIVGFGAEEVNGKKVYYTEELPVSSYGDRLSSTPTRIYQLFNDNGEAVKLTSKLLSGIDTTKLHTIDSLYELHQAMGGIYSVDFVDNKAITSEASNFAVVAFMNNVSIRLREKALPFRQSNYYQPLKEAMIAYAANNSSVKNGASNINLVSAWTDDSELSYMVLDTDGLGILLDPDHEIEEAQMTEFSLVIAALEAGGRLHDVADLAYLDLGRVALTTAKVELEALDHLATDKSKSELYDVIGRTIINNIKNNRTSDLSLEILEALQGKNFNIHDNHIKDAIKIPFSDPNIYSLLLPTFVSVINSKSVKRKYPGSGCVMVPGYGTVLLYYVDEVPHQFLDVAKKALAALGKDNPRLATETFYNYLKRLVNLYLGALLENVPEQDIGEFIPTDVVNVSWIQNGKQRTATVVLDSMDKYVQFKLSNFALKNLLTNTLDSEGRPIVMSDLKDALFTFKLNVTKPRDLAPARIWWRLGGVIHNIFDRPEIKRNFTDTLTYQTLIGRETVTRTVQIPKSWSKNVRSAEGILKYLGELAIESSINILSPKSSRAEIQKVFDNLADGFVEDDGILILVEDLHNEAALLVMSNLFKKRFGEEGSYVEILDKIKLGTAFLKKLIAPIRAKFDYDLVLVDSNNKHGFITFADTVRTTEKSDPKLSLWDQNHIKRVPIRGEKGGISSNKGNYVYTVDKFNNLQYLIGKEIVTDLKWDDIKDSKEVSEGKYRLDANNRVVEYVEYITRYKAFDKKRTGSSNHPVYQIRIDNLKRTNEYQLLPKLVSTLYNLGNYNELRLSTKIPIETVSIIQDAFPNGESTLYPFELSQHLALVKKYILLTVLEKLNASDKKDVSYILIDWDLYKGMIKKYYDIKALMMLSSFLRSLEVTASRIPALTLQSFMQMQTVGFTGSSKNMCYVSHFLTYLQGSDYDIDKAYIMMSEIDNNGKYVGWSPLFNYTSLEFLKASELLPTPAENSFVFDAASTIDITEDLQNIRSLTGPDKLKAEAKLIQKLDKIALRQGTSTLGITLNSSIFTPEEITKFTDIAKRKEANKILRDLDKPITTETQNELLPTILITLEDLLKVCAERALYRINLHEKYEIPLELREAAYKNSVSSKINRIILDLRNMDSAYSSVDEEMDTLRGIADNSPKGNLTKLMSLTNPATKFLMLVLNMVGKDVIGISATGEKIFFNLNYYWNEGIRSGDEEWIRNLQFLHTYDRIQGRNSGTPVSRTIDTVANLNMDITNPEELVTKFNEINDIITTIESEFRALGKFIARTSEEFLEAVKEEIRARHANASQADILISALLSAATDNAKELILARINADSNLAGNYLYLMSVGFSIDDIAAFMISPAITVVSSFINDNMFDAYAIKLSTTLVTNLLLGVIPYKVILTGKVRFNDPEKPGESKYYPLSSTVLNSISDALGLDSETTIKTDIIPEYIKRRLTGLETKSIKEIIPDDLGPKTYLVSVFSNYIENIILKIKTEFSKSEKPIEDLWNEFELDLQEFKIVQERAQEATSLGLTFLSLNLGLPTSEEDLLKKLKLMLGVVSRRELNIRVTLPDGGSISLDVAISRYKQTDDPEKKENYYKGIIETLKTNNPKLEESYIQEVLENSLDIAGNFNIRKWLNDLNYRKLTKEYYNIIKATWNIFDAIEKIPHYNALIKLFSTVYNINLSLSLKSKIIDTIHDLFISNDLTLDDYMLKLLTHYVDDRLIANWINLSPSTNFLLPIKSGNTYLDADFNEVTATTDLKINLKDAIGIRNFKFFMEKYLIPELLSKSLLTIYGNINVLKNPFIQNLILTEDNRGVPFYKLDIDMMAIDHSPENLQKFQDFIDGLMLLKGITYEGHSLADWFIMYNFIVNKNNYGQDRMTTIFKPFLLLSVEDNLLREYYKYLSELDYAEDKVDLKELGIYLEDAKMYIAPYKTLYLENTSKEPYIKLSINGFTIYKKLFGDPEDSYTRYAEILLIPKRTLVSKDQTELELLVRLRNQVLYGVLEAPIVNSVEYYKLGLDSNDLDTILNTLAVLASKGNLLYVIENCD